MSEPLDLIVLGTGAGGSAPAVRCRKAGWSVAIIDDQPYGGTCALRGCDPKKVLVGAADLLDWDRRMQGRGIRDGLAIDWPDLMRFKRTFTDPVPSSREAGFKKVGITTYHGQAHFISEDRLVVNGTVLQARYFVMATGARPRPLGIPGEEHVSTSTDFLNLDHLPSRIAFIGAGYISFEFAHLTQRSGSQATILGRGAALAQFEQDVVKRLVDHSRSLGIDIRLEAEVKAVEECQDGFRVLVHTDNRTVNADLVVHGAGRVPNTMALGLENAKVSTDERGGLKVNDYLQSVSNPRVYAAGDVALPAGSLPLTPVAAYEGTLVAANLLHGNSRTAEYQGIPSVVFTVPPLATVGMTEAEARRQQLDISIQTEDTSGWYTSRRVAETAAMFKTIVEKGTDRILGAHLLGPHAEEVINLFAFAMRSGLKATDLKHMIYAYPTSASDIPYML